MSCTVCKARDCTLQPFTMQEARRALATCAAVPWRAGDKYTPRDDDPRTIADIVFVPWGYHTPTEARSWMMSGKGFCYGNARDPGDFYALLHDPRFDKNGEPIAAAPQLTLF